MIFLIAKIFPPYEWIIGNPQIHALAVKSIPTHSYVQKHRKRSRKEETHKLPKLKGKIGFISPPAQASWAESCWVAAGWGMWLKLCDATFHDLGFWSAGSSRALTWTFTGTSHTSREDQRWHAAVPRLLIPNPSFVKHIQSVHWKTTIKPPAAAGTQNADLVFM